MSCKTWIDTRDRSFLFSSCPGTLSCDHGTCFRFAPQQSQLKRRLRSGTNCLLHLDMHHHQVWILGAVWCSCIACTSLLVHLYRVPANVRNRLFLLQIRYLALADLSFVIASVPTLFLEDVGPYPSTDTLASACKYHILPFNFSRHVSLWIEMHLAASVVLQFFKVQAMKPLRCALHFIWLPGLLLTLYSAFNEPWTYDPVERICVPTTFIETADPLDTADLALCVCICAGSYLTVLCGSWLQHSPLSVQGRASRKVAVYLVNALLTYGLIFVCYVDGKLFRNLTINTIARIFELLGGLFNTITYAMQSRYAAVLLGQSSLVRDNPTALRRPSYDVAFDADAEVQSYRPSLSFEVQCPPSS